MVKEESFYVGQALLVTLVYIFAVVLGTGLEYALGEPVSTAWSLSPFVKVLFTLAVFSAREEVLFRVLPVTLCITIFQGRQDRVTWAGIVSSIGFAVIHIPFGYDAIKVVLLGVFGMIMFELCYRMVQNRLERLPMAFLSVFALHYGYNVALKLLIVFFS